MSDEAADFGWAILELMGHRRLAGRVSLQELGGASFVRIDLPETESRAAATQFYNPNAVYALTPTMESVALALADRAPEPVSRWELRSIETPALESSGFDDDPSPF